MKKVLFIITSLIIFITFSSPTLMAQSDGDIFMHPYLYVSADDLVDDVGLVVNEDYEEEDLIEEKEESLSSSIKHIRCGADHVSEDTSYNAKPNYTTAGAYTVGEMMYVWAKKGYRLRNQPNTKSKVLRLVGFGEGLTIVEKDIHRYVDKAIKYVDHSFSDEIVAPYLIDGNWVKVETKDGEIGYVIDQYLLSLEPNDKVNPLAYDLNINLRKKDVKILNETLEDESIIYTEIDYDYANRITSTLEHGSNWTKTYYVLQNFKVKEAFILFSSSWGDMEDYDVLENKEKLLIVSDRNKCKISFKEVLDTVLVSFDCE